MAASERFARVASASRPDGVSGRASAPLLVRVDALILAVAAIGGVLLVAADVAQRWILPERTWTLDIDGRFNATTWFQSFVLGGGALAAIGVATTLRTRDRRLLAWLFLAATLAFMSFDKSISFHERLGQSLEEWFELQDEAGRVLWQVIYAPLLASFAAVLIWLVREDRRDRLYAILGIAAGASKLVLEAAMYPVIEWGITSEKGVLYGIEVNLEESVQLIGFALFFALLARLFIARVADTAFEAERSSGRATTAAPGS
jgi:hypothetical protein